MKLVQLLDVPGCSGIGPVVQFLKKGLLPIIQIGIPIILIVMGSVDLGKAVLSSDDKEIKGAVSKLIKRAIAAVAVFFVATIVTVVMGMFTNVTFDDDGKANTTDWGTCWRSV